MAAGDEHLEVTVLCRSDARPATVRVELCADVGAVNPDDSTTDVLAIRAVEWPSSDRVTVEFPATVVRSRHATVRAFGGDGDRTWAGGVSVSR